MVRPERAGTEPATLDAEARSSQEAQTMQATRTKATCALAAAAILWCSQVVGATPTGTAPPAVVASALDGSLTQLTPCNGPTQTLGNPGFLKVERPGASNGTIFVNVSYAGTLMPGTDYEPLPNPIEIPAGDTQTVVAVEALAPGSVSLSVEPGDGYVVGDPATATTNFERADVPTFCSEAIVETIEVGEAPTNLLVEEEFDGPPVADLAFEPEGSAPPGLALERDGTWSGAATTEGTYEIAGRWCLGASLCVIEVPWRITVVASTKASPPPPPATPIEGAAAYTG
jgi:hypothetical protein